VQSVVLYGSETWTMRKVDSDRIQSFHMQALRRILGIRWYDKVSNTEVNERTKLPDVPSLIADRCHSLFGHIGCLLENIPATVNRSPHQHSSHRWLEAPAGSSTKKLAATSGRRHWPICWCCSDCGPGSFDVEDATTLSWSSAVVSEWFQTTSNFMHAVWHTCSQWKSKFEAQLFTDNTLPKSFASKTKLGYWSPKITATNSTCHSEHYTLNQTYFCMTCKKQNTKLHMYRICYQLEMFSISRTIF